MLHANDKSESIHMRDTARKGCRSYVLHILCTTYVSVCSYSYSTYKDIPGIRSNDSHWPLSALALACMHITISDFRQPRREGNVHKSISFLALSRHILGTNFSASNGEIEMQLIP